MRRSSFVTRTLVVIVLSTLVPWLATSVHGQESRKRGQKPASGGNRELLITSSFTDTAAMALHVYAFDRADTSLHLLNTYGRGRNINFFALNKAKSHLYAVGDVHVDSGKQQGRVLAYTVTSGGQLSEVNGQHVAGAGPAHISLDPRGRFVYVSNYGSGNLAVFALKADKSMGSLIDSITLQGTGKDPGRQEKPHVHSIIPSADGRFIYVSDLGTDRILIYQVNGDGNLTPAAIPYVKAEGGAGPRHFALHPRGTYAYSVEELSSTMSVYRVNRKNGSLTFVQRISMLPDGYKEKSYAADVHLSPDGRFVYATNRGHDSFAIFRVEDSTGRLTLAGHESTRGSHPRNFGLSNDGRFIFVVNRDSNNLVIFTRDAATGLLAFTGRELHVPKAVCVVASPGL